VYDVRRRLSAIACRLDIDASMPRIFTERRVISVGWYACRETGMDRDAYNRAAKEILDHIRSWKSLDSGWRVDWEKIRSVESQIDYRTICDIRMYAKMYGIQL